MKHKKISWTVKYVVIVALLLVVADVVLGAILVNQSKSAMRTLIRKNMLDVANTAAAMMDGDTLGALTEADVGTPVFNDIAATLTVFQDQVDIKYIYAVKAVGEREFVFTVDPDPVDPGRFGESVVFTEALYRAGQGEAAVDSEPFADRWGNFYSAYSPVFDSEGRVAGIIGIDFDAEWFDAQIAKQSVSILVACVVSLVAGALIVILFFAQVRRKFAALGGEIADLSADVDLLAEEIASDTAYTADKGTAAAEGNAALPRDAAAEDDASGEIEALGKRIRATRRELKRYIAYVQAQAYTDTMTGVGNKTAYLDLVKNLNRRIEEGTAAFAVAVFDLNGLKNMNDNFGHEYGDTMLTHMATVIRRVFGKEHTFRIGGDEFIAITEDMDEAGVTERFAALDEEIRLHNERRGEEEGELSLSGGFAVFDAACDKSFKTVFKRADEAMYRDKGEYYRQFGDRRRQN